MNANHRIQMNYDVIYFLCPSDEDVKSEIPCAGTATCARHRSLLQSSLRVGSLGPLQRQNLLGNTKFILLSVALKIADLSRYIDA